MAVVIVMVVGVGFGPLGVDFGLLYISYGALLRSASFNDW